MVKPVYFSFLMWKKHVPPLVDGKTNNLSVVGDFVSLDCANFYYNTKSLTSAR